MANPCIVNTLGMTDDEVNEKIKAGTWERCEYCKCVFIWDKLPDENVVTYRQRSEFWGAPAYETIVSGFVCPECGYKTNF